MKKVFSLMLLLATMFTFTACSSDDDDETDSTKLSKTAYTMYAEGTQNIEGTNVSNIVWDSDNEFVATVKNNVITGQYVGKTTVKSTTKNLLFTVEVMPKYRTYEEPCLEWGISKASIKAKYGTPTKETSDGLIYQTSNTDVPYMTFVFENDKLYVSGVICKTSIASQLAEFLTERYVPTKVDMSNYTAAFAHCYGKISDPQIDYVVGMQYGSSVGGLVVAYSPFSGSRSSNKMDYNSAFKSIEEALK